MANFDFLVAGKFGIFKYGNFETWEYGSMGIWEFGNMGMRSMGIWEYGFFETWKLWRILKVKSIQLDPRLYSSVSYVDYSYFSPYCFDFIHQGLRNAELILEEDTF